MPGNSIRTRNWKHYAVRISGWAFFISRRPVCGTLRLRGLGEPLRRQIPPGISSFAGCFTIMRLEKALRGLGYFGELCSRGERRVSVASGLAASLLGCSKRMTKFGKGLREEFFRRRR